MTVKIQEATKMRLTSISRLHNSINGIPRWRVEFTDVLNYTFTMTTKTDAEVNYSIDYYAKDCLYDILYHTTAAGNFVLDVVYDYRVDLSKALLIGGYVNTSAINKIACKQIQTSERLQDPIRLGKKSTDVIISALAGHFGVSPCVMFGWLRTHKVGERDLSQARRFIMKYRPIH